MKFFTPKIYLLTTALAATLAAPASAAPQPPSQIRLTIVTGGIEVTWQKSPDDPLDISGYEVMRGTFVNGAFQNVCTTRKGAISCMDWTAQPGNTYYYKMRSLAIGEPSLFSSEVSVAIPATPPPVPVADR